MSPVQTLILYFYGSDHLLVPIDAITRPAMAHNKGSVMHVVGSRLSDPFWCMTHGTHYAIQLDILRYLGTYYWEA